MQPRIQRLVWTVCVLLFLLCLTAKTLLGIFFFEAFIICSLLLAAVLLYRLIHEQRYTRCVSRFAGILWCAMLLATVSPVGISLKAAPGLPRLVPLVPGKPGSEAREAAQRGECVLSGSCIAYPGLPAWVLVW